MNQFEKLIYNSVKHNPKLKFFIRDLYQSVFDLIPVKSAKTSHKIIARPNCFFGFHDHTPFSPNNSMLLSGKFDIPLRIPKPTDKLEIGYFKGKGYKEFVPLTDTKAWNWHQGAKLQWVGHNSSFIFNDHEDGCNISIVFNIETGQSRNLPASISAVSPDGKWGVGYSFARVESMMPGYGYKFPTSEGDLTNATTNKSGIYITDLGSGKTREIFSIADIIDINKVPSMEGCRHFLSHTIFSPTSKRFLFLHRWITDDIRNRKSTLMTSDIEGKDIRVFPTDEMASHLAWKNDTEILAYARVKDRGDNYFIFDDSNPSSYTILGENQFTSDGHPSYDITGRWIITDTYPDRSRRCSLILYDTLKKQRHDLAKLKSPKKFATITPERHWQCDLHPRWDRKGTTVCFDSTFTGERSLCTINLEHFLAKALSEE